MFYDVLFKSGLPPHELTTERMAAEGTLIVVAGSETVGYALTNIHYHLLANPEKLARLKQELVEAMPDPNTVPKWQDLRRLPYLTACIEETLRVSSPVMHRLARLAPKQGLRYQEFEIPAGVSALSSRKPGFAGAKTYAKMDEFQTAVSMTTYLTHMNASIFPSPYEFIPERWLEPSAKHLKKYLNPFSKGTRSCLGTE